MKVKLVDSYQSNRKVSFPGAVLELDSSESERLIGIGVAIAYIPLEQPSAETQAEAQTEGQTDPQAADPATKKKTKAAEG